MISSPYLTTMYSWVFCYKLNKQKTNILKLLVVNQPAHLLIFVVLANHITYNGFLQENFYVVVGVTRKTLYKGIFHFILRN